MTVLQTDPLTVWVLRDLHMTRTPHPTGKWASYRLEPLVDSKGVTQCMESSFMGVSYDSCFRLDLNQ